MSSLGSTVTTEANEDNLANTYGEAKKVKRWVQEIKFYEAKAHRWEEKGKKILRRYKDDRSPREQKVPRYNILWSIVESSKPALFSANPKPDIERRFRDKDDLGRISSMVLERSISYFIGEAFGDACRQAVADRLLPGRGLVWARYEPHFKDASENENAEVADEGPEITDNVSGDYAEDTAGGESESPEGDNTDEVLENEVICWDYVHWQDFGHCFGRTWDEVPGAWRKVYLTREELEKRFGKEIGSKITLDYSPHDLKDNKYDEIEKKATIYEIWDKCYKTVLWIHKDFAEKPLDEKDDPLGLEGFFPFPMPLFATLANDECIPVPDYVEWQDQADELDELTSRIGSITKCIKVAGVYASDAAGIGRLLAEGVENQLVPIDQWAVFAEKGGMKGIMELLPMEEILKTLLGLYEAREQVKQDLYEISGSADIMRGQSDPDETYGAQNIKAQFGTMRLNDKQEQIKRFCRDLIKIGTQIIANHFSIETIKKICGMQLLTDQEKQLVQTRMQMLTQMQQQSQQTKQQLNPQMLQSLPPLPDWLQKLDQDDMDELMDNPTWEEVDGLIRDEVMLSYKIDIETESTIKFDQEADKAARVEFLEAVGKFISAAQNNQNPDLAPLLAKLLMFGVRGFKIGKELETAFDIAIHKLEKDAQNPQQKQDPEMAKVQGEMALGQQRLQADMQIEAQKAKDEQARLQMQAKVDQHQAQVDAQLEQFKAQIEDGFKRWQAKLDAETKITVAEIQAKASTQQAAMNGAQEAQPQNDMNGLLAEVSAQLKTLISNSSAQPSNSA